MLGALLTAMFSRDPHSSSSRRAIRKFAQMLADRYSSRVACTRSWDSNPPDFLVHDPLIFCFHSLFFSHEHYSDIRTGDY